MASKRITEKLKKTKILKDRKNHISHIALLITLTLVMFAFPLTAQVFADPEYADPEAPVSSDGHTVLPLHGHDGPSVIGHNRLKQTERRGSARGANKAIAPSVAPDSQAPLRTVLHSGGAWIP